MYDRGTECITKDEARNDLFTRKGRAIDNISPCSAALHQHTKRAAYQAGFCWDQSLVKLQETHPGAGSVTQMGYGNHFGQRCSKHQSGVLN